MPLYHYETSDGTIHELFMFIPEWERRDKKGRIRLDDGRRAQRVYVKRHRGQRANADLSSLSMALCGESAEAALTEDRRINPNSAPDHYDADGVPHWKGDAIAARMRKRQYCHERGMAWHER
uniref:Uncharacterized protein n=1 Tax=viral metagenome TaxID=1070528 RepID=A0A6M3KEQ6_9ZZZZ